MAAWRGGTVREPVSLLGPGWASWAARDPGREPGLGSYTQVWPGCRLHSLSREALHWGQRALDPSSVCGAWLLDGYVPWVPAPFSVKNPSQEEGSREGTVAPKPDHLHTYQVWH